MGLSFTVDTSGMTAIKETIETASERAEHILAIQVEKDTIPFVPMLEGVLTRGTRVVGSDIIYPGPYARYLYYGKVMVDEHGNGPMHFVDKHGNVQIKFPEGSKLHATDRNLVFRRDHHPQAQSHWFEASKAQNLEKWLRIAGKLVKNGGNS